MIILLVSIALVAMIVLIIVAFTYDFLAFLEGASRCGIKTAQDAEGSHHFDYTDQGVLNVTPSATIAKRIQNAERGPNGVLRPG